MTSPSYRTPLPEQAAIHAACCRSKKQGLVCGTCCELNERAARAAKLAQEAA